MHKARTLSRPTFTTSLLFTTLPFLLLSRTDIAADQTAAPQKNMGCRIPGLCGTVPDEIATFIKRSNENNSAQLRIGVKTNPLVETQNQPQRILFYGPPGNGKTTYAHAIAEQTHSVLIEEDAASLVGKYLGSGPEKIKQLELKIKQAIEHGQKVTVFIDEVESLVGSNETEIRSAHKDTTSELIVVMDRFKHNKNVIFLFATNDIKKVNRAFINRLHLIEIGHPSLENRREIFSLIFFKPDLVFLDYEIISDETQKITLAHIKIINEIARECTALAEANIQDIKALEAWRMQAKQICGPFNTHYYQLTNNIKVIDYSTLHSLVQGYGQTLEGHLEQLHQLLITEEHEISTTAPCAIAEYKINTLIASLRCFNDITATLLEIDSRLQDVTRPIQANQAQAAWFDQCLQKINASKKQFYAYNLPALHQTATPYFAVVDAYITAATHYAQQPAPTYDQHVIEQLAQETEGLSVRSLMRIAAEIRIFFERKQQGTLTSEQMWLDIKNLIAQERKNNKELQSAEELTAIVNKLNAYYFALSRSCGDEKIEKMLKEQYNPEALEKQILQMKP